MDKKDSFSVRRNADMKIEFKCTLNDLSWISIYNHF